MNRDVVVPIVSVLLVHEPCGMHQLVQHCPDLGETTGRLQVHLLHVANATHRRPTPGVCLGDVDVVPLTGVADELQTGVAVIDVEGFLDHGQILGFCNSYLFHM